MNLFILIYFIFSAVNHEFGTMEEEEAELRWKSWLLTYKQNDDRRVEHPAAESGGSPP